MTLYEMFTQSVAQYGDEPLIWFRETWLSFRETKTRVDRFATTLHRLGLRQGDIVALQLTNSPQFVIAFYGVLALGGIILPLDPNLTSAEIHRMITFTSPKMGVILKSIVNTHFTQEMQALFLHIITVNPADLSELSIPSEVPKDMSSFSLALQSCIPFTVCLMEQGKQVETTPSFTIDPIHDTAVLAITSGTTGTPKLAAMSHLSLVASAYQAAHILQAPGTRYPALKVGKGTGNIGIMPIYHSFGLNMVMNFAIVSGSWIVLFESPPSSDEQMKAIASLPAEHGFILCAAEIIFRRFTQLDATFLETFPLKGKIRLAIAGVTPIHQKVWEDFERLTGAALTYGFGLSESSSVSLNPFFTPRVPRLLGLPLPGIDWVIFSPDSPNLGPLVEIGIKNIGEIGIAGPQLMTHYWKNPEATATTFTTWQNQKFLLTGDLGYMDEWGRIHLTGRKKDLIKLAGHSIYPHEVEQCLKGHPAILDAAVRGIADDHLGEIVEAWIIVDPPQKSTITSQILKQWCHTHLAHYKIPSRYEFVSKIPRTKVGKIHWEAMVTSQSNKNANAR
ncbi:MAG: AMP-binding protein [Promethearchaeota archaeon]